MPKQLFPIPLPYADFVYDDQKGSPSTLNLEHLSESFRIADLLKQLSYEDASECVRPLRLLSGFKPAEMIDRLTDHAEKCGGPACIVSINSERMPDFIWSYDCANGVNRLVNLKRAGTHVFGVLSFPSAGGVCAYPESGPDEELALMILNSFARGYQENPRYRAADELLRVSSFDDFSDWQEKYEEALMEPILFPHPDTDEIQGEAS